MAACAECVDETACLCPRLAARRTASLSGPCGGTRLQEAPVGARHWPLEGGGRTAARQFPEAEPVERPRILLLLRSMGFDTIFGRDTDTVFAYETDKVSTSLVPGSPSAAHAARPRSVSSS